MNEGKRLRAHAERQKGFSARRSEHWVRVQMDEKDASQLGHRRESQRRKEQERSTHEPLRVGVRVWRVVVWRAGARPPTHLWKRRRRRLRQRRRVLVVPAISCERRRLVRHLEPLEGFPRSCKRVRFRSPPIGPCFPFPGRAVEPGHRPMASTCPVLHLPEASHCLPRGRGRARLCNSRWHHGTLSCLLGKAGMVRDVPIHLHERAGGTLYDPR